MNENVRDPVISNAHRGESSLHDFLLKRSSKEIATNGRRFKHRALSFVKGASLFFDNIEGEGREAIT